MHTLRQKNNIPHYSLQQSCRENNGNGLFEIREIDGAQFQRSVELFLPHRKDYYFFFLVKEGANRHWIDFVPYEVIPDYLYFTHPHQVHLKEQNIPVSGTLLAFTEEFLLSEGQASWKKLPILHNPDDRHALKCSDTDKEFLHNLFRQIETEHHQQKDWKNGMLQSYLKIFLVYLSRLYTSQFNNHPSPCDDPSLVRRMKELLNEKYDSLHQVADYASLLNVTPGHLNDTLRLQTGRTATSLIHERIIMEAKRALFHTTLSIKEIGYSLGFDDPAYFHRFFKRLTGTTPLDFRNTIRETHQ